MDVVGGLTRLRADRIVLCELYARELHIPAVLVFIDGHRQLLGHGVVSPLHAVAVWMVGACGKFIDPKDLINSLCTLGAELKAVVREDGAWASPEENVFIDQDVGRALSGELCGGDREHLSPTTETVGGEQDVTVASRRDRKKAERVDPDGDAATFRQRHGEYRPSESQSWVFPHFVV